MKLYAISGLGADKRVYKNLTLDYEIVHLDWIEPNKNEKIEDYAIRLAQKIDITQKFGIIGVSFGGLIAVEISKVLNPEMTILISSTKTKHGLRSLYRFFGRTGINKILHKSMYNPPKKVIHYLFGTKEIELLNKILNDTDLNFTKWAVNELINWKNIDEIANCIHIHGNKDKLIKYPKDKNTILLEAGEHLMIVDKAKELSTIINNKLRGFRL